MRRTAFFLLLTAATPAFAQQAAPAISEATLKEVTQTLSADEFEGRAPATPAEEKTVAYLIERFQKAGLKPGNAGKWTQDVPMVEITATDTSPLTFTGGKGGTVSLAYRTDAVFGTYRVVPRIDLKDSPVVFVGYGIQAPERNWDDYAGVDVKGKTVVILINDPDYEAADRTGPFEGRAMTYYGRWIYKFEEAARQGAAAAIIVHDTIPAAYGWNVAQTSWTGPQLGIDRGERPDQSQVVGWMQKGKAEELMRAAGQGLAALTAAAKKPGFRAVPLGVKANVSFANTVRRQASKNVIGVLPGTATPDEVVLYSAHWDHIGRCDPVDGDDICNGAVDNATGTAGLVAIAEAQVKAGAAKRTMAFVAVTGEESGLLGSEWYATHPVFPLNQTVGGVNMDGLNVIGRARDFVITGAGKSELEDLVKPLVAAENRVITAEPHPERGGYFRSDHFSMAKRGVPMLSAGSGQDLVEGGSAAGAAATEDYVKNRYHQPADEYDPKWNWAGALEDLTIYYGMGRALADGGGWPNWYPSSEFRKIRDESRAGK